MRVQFDRPDLNQARIVVQFRPSFDDLDEREDFANSVNVHRPFQASAAASLDVIAEIGVVRVLGVQALDSSILARPPIPVRRLRRVPHRAPISVGT